MRIEELEKLPRIRRIGLEKTFLAWHAVVDEESYRELANKIKAKGGRLVALWGSDNLWRDQAIGGECEQATARFSIHVAFYVQVHSEFIIKPGLLWISLDVPDTPGSSPAFPSLCGLFPSAARMERAIRDLLGLSAEGLADLRPWLRHGAWPAEQFPLRKDFPLSKSFPRAPDDYPFVRVEGEGVHEIPVGPVHAGIIEPGHFRFQVVGEKILRLEERLGYTHKGIEKRLEGMDFMSGARLAGRISGDSTVAHAFAYALAIENVTESKAPPRALWLRALCLERERIANHLGDLGAIGNDAGLAFGLAQFSRLKEDMLRTNRKSFGHRYLMDVIVPGGLASDLDGDEAVLLIEQEAQSLMPEIDRLQEIYEEHAGLQDRLANTGQIRPDLAARLGLIGVAGRASGQGLDLRVQCPVPPYDRLKVNITTHQDGDVEARVAVRFGELRESLRLQQEILAQLPEGAIHTPLNPSAPYACGIGWVEGWRGEVFSWVRADESNRIDRCHPHDPSWMLWPALEYAVLGDIVPDFPLVNKSFNLSYSGHDL
jgi:Ni,Fe-hydrogenase III large subunit/Ni,Fe-hydrogenase III component G